MTKGDQLKTMLDQLVKDTGIELQRSTAEVAAYTVQRSAYITPGSVEAGFAEAVQAEAHNVILFAGVKAVQDADRADQRLIGIILGALAVISPPPA